MLIEMIPDRPGREADFEPLLDELRATTLPRPAGTANSCSARQCTINAEAVSGS